MTAMSDRNSNVTRIATANIRIGNANRKLRVAKNRSVDVAR